MIEEFVNEIYEGDAREILQIFPDQCINCCVTSPPYFGLRDYGVKGQLGLEQTPDEYITKMVEVFHEVKRVLKDDGTLWLNIGDSYWGSGKAGNNPEYQKHHTAFGKLEEKERFGKPTTGKHNYLKNKDLIGIPWMLAFALRADGWYLRQDIIWHKPNPMPESVTDRCTKAHEYIFLLSKSNKYYFNNKAIEEPCVWDISGNETAKRIARADESHKAMPSVFKNGIRPKKKGPQTFGGSKARIAQLNGGDPRNGHRTDENSQWGKVWDSNKSTRNKRSVWTVTTKPFKQAHFATFPPDLIEPCILAGSAEGGIILDPFMGAGTTALVSKKFNRKYLGIELNPEYITIANERLK